MPGRPKLLTVTGSFSLAAAQGKSNNIKIKKIANGLIIFLLDSRNIGWFSFKFLTRLILYKEFFIPNH